MEIENYCNKDKLNAICLTFDTDWAPSFVIDKLVNYLVKNNLKATFFATNKCDVLKAAEKEGQIEISLHPNFFNGSTHGSNIADVLKHLKDLFPNAVGLRSHGLYQSSPLLRSMSDFGIKYDCNLLMYDQPFLQPFDTFYDIVRIPYSWSDASHILENREFDLKELYLKNKGLKIFDFHPMLWYLNSKNYDTYNEIKKSHKNLLLLNQTDLENYINREAGVYSMFDELTNYINQNNITTYFLKDLYSAFSKLENKKGPVCFEH